MNIKSIISIVGIVLIILGIIGFSYGYFTYQSTENVMQFGNMKVTATQDKTVSISPVLSGLSLAAGLVLVIIGVVSRKK